MTMHLILPAPWDDELLSQWKTSGSESRTLFGIYGCKQRQLVGHGRAPLDVPFVPDERIRAHASLARSLGVEFAYLLNGRCEHLDVTDSRTLRRIREDLEWVVEDVRANCVVISDLRVARIARSLYKRDRLGLRVSTIASVRCPEDLADWLPLDPESVVLHHDLARDFRRLGELTRFVHSTHSNVEIELIVNESCLPHCEARDAHYAKLSAATPAYREGFQQACNLAKLRRPSTLLSASWVRPEDLAYYAEFGISRFKIAGREMPLAWLDRAFRAYASGKHSGNLVDLLTMTPPALHVSAPELVQIHNPSLGGFLEGLVRARGWEDAYYEDWTVRLWKGGQLRIIDPGSAYKCTGGVLRCSQAGEHHLTLKRKLACSHAECVLSSRG